MNNVLIHIHSGLRWVILIMLLVAIINAISSKKKNIYEKKDKMINLFAMVSLHLQLVIGLILYFISARTNFSDGWMKVDMFRFYGMEHLLIMIAGIAIVTIGRRKAENATAPSIKHSKIALWYTIGLIIILAGIPWPFREALGGQWF